MRMNTIYWHMNAKQGGANLHPGVNLLPGAILHPCANCAHEHGFKPVKSAGIDTLLLSITNTGVFKTLATTSHASLFYHV